MTRQRWEKIEQLYHAALERQEDQRAAYLKQACAGDDLLYREVESLLAEAQSADQFLERPAVEAVAEMLAENQPSYLPGQQLGSYTILSLLGAGGMGVVYRARDLKLGRDVAIKVLPEAFAHDVERMARFQREAKVLASLNHPNIATIHGLEDTGGTRALVMELVEGPTLAGRTKAGPISIDEALPIAKQICEALEYAHERGIIHRDLKPANVKVATNDTVKILDFGLAKALETGVTETGLGESPAITRMATQEGVLLGTAAYMAPEQAKGKPVDRRADIWAFGCVLYEMLAGKQAFTGETATESLAAVILKDPDWSQLPAATPMRVRILLQRCLQKDPKQRLQAIGDARISLEEVLSGTAEPTPATLTAPPVKRWPLWVTSGAAIVLLVAFSALAFIHFREKPTPAPIQRYEIAAPPSVSHAGALSPDGTHLALESTGGNSPRLWLRRMGSLEAHPIEGTEGVNGIPFWSPDSRFIAFNTLDGKLKKIDIEGGPVQVLCDSGVEVLGGFWTPDGKIVFGDPRRLPGLWEVPAGGGVSYPLPGVESPGGRGNLYGPVLLPDARHFLYSTGGSGSTDVYLGSLDSKPGRQRPRKLLTGVISTVVYTPSSDDPGLGYLLFVAGTSSTLAAGPLMAQPFDLRKLETVGEPVLIAEQVGWDNFTASLTGTMVYLSANSAAGFAVFDRQGKILETVGEPSHYRFVAFSPDGRRVVASRSDSQSGSSNLWMMDLARGISTRFTFDSGTDIVPTWSPDGSRVAFSSNRNGNYDLYEKLSNGGSDEQLAFKSETGTAYPTSWSANGRFLLVGLSPPLDMLVSVLPLDGNGHAGGKPFVFVQKGVGIELRFSPGPQGRPLWVAYSSKESGRWEIYVRPFDPNSPTGIPPGGGKWQVSTEGGMSPRWNNNGKELFYVAPDGTVMSVEVSGNAVFQSGTPKPLFKPQGLAPQPSYFFDWDASSDGKKFIFAVLQSASGAAPPARFTVVLNWPALLKK